MFNKSIVLPAGFLTLFIYKSNTDILGPQDTTLHVDDLLML